MDVKFFRFMSQETMYKNASCSKTSIPTPPNIVRDMLDLVPKELWGNKDAKVLNLACKDGNFLYRVCELFMEGLKHEIPDEQERLNHIINNCLYACICRDTDIQGKWLGLVDIEKIYNLGCCLDLPESNIFVVDNGKWGLEFYSSNIEKESVKMLEFDLVVGNPPYNNDLYLDFVLQAQELSKDKVVMLTPAKWQAKLGKKNEDFREKAVPYMDKIIFYPDTKEVFDIGETGGISYFIIDKYIHSSKNVKSICAVNKFIISNDFEMHDEDTLMLASRKILNIIGKVGTLGEGFKQSLYVKNSDRGEPTIEGTLGMKRSVFVGEQERGLSNTVDKVADNDYVEILQGEKVVGYKRISDLKTTENLDKYKIIMNAALFGSLMYDTEGKVRGVSKCYCLKPYQVPKGSFAILHYFDTEQECKSFMSYFDTNLVAFLFFFSLGGTSISRTFFRFIPDPQDWTVIYEDRPLPNYIPDSNGFYIDSEGNKHCSLYAKYGLSEGEINIIESTIKERA